VNFYDRLQELSNPHLLPLIPFNSIILKYRFEGLFPPGLGTRRYATCGRALMDFLPRLIPATLSSRVNATLTAVWCESMNGYDYLWRVLELYVPGFDPVLAIETPRWEDSDEFSTSHRCTSSTSDSKGKFISTTPTEPAAEFSYGQTNTPITRTLSPFSRHRSILTERILTRTLSLHTFAYMAWPRVST
jgi:hypothetical protein